MIMTTTNVHGIDDVVVKPIERVDASGEGYSREYWYRQEIIAKGEDGGKVAFSVFFSDAVNARLESERLQAEKCKEDKR